MKTIFRISLLMCLFTNCSEKRSQQTIVDTSEKELVYDTSVIAILPFDTSRHCFYAWSQNKCFPNTRPASITQAELSLIRPLMESCIKKFNSGQTALQARIDAYRSKHPEHDTFMMNQGFIDLENYKYQYIAFFNEHGEKEIWVNAFANMSIPGDADTYFKDWKTTRVHVQDGGTDFFELYVNLATNTVHDFNVGCPG